MGVPIDTVASNLDTVDRVASMLSLRDIEAVVLLEAVMALHYDGLLTDAEYQHKRQRLAAQAPISSCR